MTKREKIREGIARRLPTPAPDWVLADILIEYLHSQGVVIKVESELPKQDIYVSPAFGATVEQESKMGGYDEAQQNMLKAGYVAVEPLIGDRDETT